MSTRGKIIIGAAAVEGLAAAVARDWPRPDEGSNKLESLTFDEDEHELREQVDDQLPAAVSALRSADRGHGLLVAPDDCMASLLQSFLAERGMANASTLLEQGKLREVADGGLEAMFDPNDFTGWVLDYLPAWLKGRFTKHDFVPPSESVGAIADKARIAILGDWGTAMYGAPVCAASIAKTRPPYSAVVHLGDVYYAGTTTEVANRFLAAWPHIEGATNWALNSNHEMYSGGEGYFEETLKDPRFANRSSCFAFQSSHFLFLGLDTGYDEHDIAPSQVAWIGRRVAEAGARKIVLLSHHQPFSQFESGGEKLVQKLGPLLTGRRIFAWYWGHEHRCVFFDRHPDWGIWGRCIGHSGYPAFRDTFQGKAERTNSDDSKWWRVGRTDGPSALVLDGPNPYVQGHASEYSPNGYISLDLDGPILHETVHAPDGTVLLTSRLE